MLWDTLKILKFILKVKSWEAGYPWPFLGHVALSCKLSPVFWLGLIPRLPRSSSRLWVNVVKIKLKSYKRSENGEKKGWNGIDAKNAKESRNTMSIRHSRFLGSLWLQWILTLLHVQGSWMHQFEVHLAKFPGADFEISLSQVFKRVSKRYIM